VNLNDPNLSSVTWAKGPLQVTVTPRGLEISKEAVSYGPMYEAIGGGRNVVTLTDEEAEFLFLRLLPYFREKAVSAAAAAFKLNQAAGLHNIMGDNT
jgi:hypothetical protein